MGPRRTRVLTPQLLEPIMTTINLQALKIERTETGEFVASAGTYHTGYGQTREDAVQSLLWSMENE